MNADTARFIVKKNEYWSSKRKAAEDREYNDKLNKLVNKVLTRLYTKIEKLAKEGETSHTSSIKSWFLFSPSLSDYEIGTEVCKRLKENGYKVNDWRGSSYDDRTTFYFTVNWE